MTTTLSSLAVHGPTVLGTVVTALLVLTGALVVRRSASVDRPGMLQLATEATVTGAERLSGGERTRYNRRAVGVAVTLFWFILAANWLPLLPGSPLPAPTSNINLTLALALTVIAIVHVTAVQARGWRGYLRHYLTPVWMAPLRLLEELVKPLTLALRLFGVLFASALMVVLLGQLLPAPVAALPHAIWALFDVFMGVVQAFIFALLTLLYFQAAQPAATTTPQPEGAT